jgi:predicted MFS family arabinose efflux permease
VNRRREWELLGITTAALFASMVARLVASPLVPDVMRAFSVSKSEVGLALTGLWGALALFQFPAGLIADRIGERRTVLLSVGTAGLACLGLAAAPSFPLFALAAVIVGAAAGLYFTPGSAFLSKQFEDTGRALGIHEIGANAGGLVGPVAASFVAVRVGWRGGPLVATGVAAVVFVVFAARVPATPAENPDQSLRGQLDVRRLGALLSRPSIVFTALVATAGFFVWQSFASFFPTFLVEYGGLSSETASLSFGSVFALVIVGAPALGRASDRFGRDVTTAASMLVGVAGFVLVLSRPTPPAILVGTALLGVGLSYPGVVNSRFMDNLAESERGAGLGLVRSIVLLGSSLGSVVTGTLADRYGWTAAVGLLVALFVLVAVALLLNRVFGSQV